METMASVINDRSRTFTQYLLLVAMIVIASALVCIRPVLAQTDGEFTPEMSIEHYGSPMASDPADQWDYTPPALADPTLAPAPKESVEPPLLDPPLEFTPGLAGDFIEPWDNPAIPATSPMVVSQPDLMGRPGGGIFAPIR